MKSCLSPVALASLGFLALALAASLFLIRRGRTGSTV